MQNQNINQKRAKNSLKEIKYEGKEGGEVVKKIPVQIRENGLLGALAFAYENQQKTGNAKVFTEVIIPHLKELKIIDQEYKEIKGFIKYLVKENASKLREVTQESLAILNFLRRFQKK